MLEVMQVQSRAFGDLSRIVFLTPWGRKVYGWMPQHPWLDVDNEFISLCNQINLLSKFYHDWMTKISVSSLGLINLFHSNESCAILIKFVIVMLRSLECDYHYIYHLSLYLHVERQLHCDVTLFTPSFGRVCGNLHPAN